MARDKTPPVGQGSLFGGGGRLEPTTAQEYALYGGVPPHERRSETSRAAATSVRSGAGKMQQAVYECIGAEPAGLTCDAVEERMNGRHQSISARVRELFLLGRIRKDGTRKTRSGRSAVVYVTTSTGDPR